MSHSSRVPVEEKFSLPLFLLTIAVSLAVLAGLLWLVAPATVWQAQIGTTWGAFVAVFLAMTMVNVISVIGTLPVLVTR